MGSIFGNAILRRRRARAAQPLALFLCLGLTVAACEGTRIDPSGGLAPAPGQAMLIAKADERGFASNTGRVQVTGIDGAARSTGRGTLGLTNRLALPAGPRTVSFIYAVSYGCQVVGCKTKTYDGQIRFNAEEGRRYQLHAAISTTEKLFAWIVDETDGRIVAGRLPPGAQ